MHRHVINLYLKAWEYGIIIPFRAFTRPNGGCAITSHVFITALPHLSALY